MALNQWFFLSKPYGRGEWCLIFLRFGEYASPTVRKYMGEIRIFLLFVWVEVLMECFLMGSLRYTIFVFTKNLPNLERREVSVFVGARENKVGKYLGEIRVFLLCGFGCQVYIYEYKRDRVSFRGRLSLG